MGELCGRDATELSVCSLMQALTVQHRLGKATRTNKDDIWCDEFVVDSELMDLKLTIRTWTIE